MTDTPTSAGLQPSIQSQAAARARPLQRPGVDHKLLGLVVHGIGEQAIGSTLKHFANGFLPLIRARIDPEASIAAKPLDEGDPAEVRIWFRKKAENENANDEVYEIRFFEVWWAQAFDPPSLGGFISGLLGFFSTWLRRGDRHAPIWPHWRYWGWAVFQRIVVDVAIVLVSPLLVLLLLVLWLVESAGPLTRFLPGWLAAAHRTLVNIATRHLGDMWVYLRQPWEASRIRVRFEERLHELIELVENDPEKEKVDAVFVIAHSMGAVVAYEALTGRRTTDLLQRKFQAQGQPTFHFVSVGSALNSAWDVVPDRERFRFYREFAPAVQWLNLWSGPDPVARGALRLPTIKDAQWQRGGPASFEDRGVVNQMDIFSDHSAYWNNAEQVIAPILDAVTQRQLQGYLQLNVKARERRVSVLGALKAFGWLVFPVVFAIMLATGAGQWISDWTEAAFLAGNPWQRFLAPLLWAAIAAAGVVLLYSSLIKWLWDLWDRAVKYR